MPQLRVGGPLGELDLRDQLAARTQCGRSFVLRLWRERALVGFERPQQLHHPRELALVEAGAGVADVDEARSFVDAEQQRAEVGARLARLGPAADDEFLLWTILILRQSGVRLPDL